MSTGDAKFQFGVVILGAGKSRRMGYPKLLLPWHGTTVVGFLLQQWQRLGARQVAVAWSGEDVSLEMELDQLGLPERSRIPVAGADDMFHSIRSSAHWPGWVRGLTHCVVSLGDQPHLRETTLAQLLAFARLHPEAICQPSRQGRPRHPVCLPQAVFARLRETNAANLREFLAGEQPARLCEVDDPALEFDMDYPEDYQRARELAGCSGVIRPMLLGREPVFPNPALADAEGLVAVGGDFSVPRLLQAYRSGIFPWSVDPITWWSPDPRGIFEMEGLHVPRSLERFMRRKPFAVTMDQAFSEVMRACAEPGQGRGGSSWITPEFIDAYTELHRAGHAHSVECWKDNRLVGGIYGVTVGGLFAGESMFHRESNASKVALAHLHAHLKSRGFALFDVQMVTPATEVLGAVRIPRREYLQRLALATAQDAVF